MSSTVGYWGYGGGGGRSQHSPLFGHFLSMEVSITQKNGADIQHSQQQIWPSKSASTQKIEYIVSIRKKLNPQIQLILGQALRDQAIKSVKTSSKNSIAGLDYLCSTHFLELEEVPPLFTKTVKMCLSFNFHFEKGFAPPLPTLNNVQKDILSRVGRGVIDKSQTI